MQEHPVPQDITGYKFHIIGEMTIKQFAQVGLGAFLAFLVYTTNLPQMIKWAIMLILFLVGAAAAFVPIEEQPIDHWITTFIKVLYKPTKYFWKKEAKIPDAFAYKAKKIDNNPQLQRISTQEKLYRATEYISSVAPSIKDEFDVYEDNRASQLLQSFYTPNVKIGSAEQSSETRDKRQEIRDKRLETRKQEVSSPYYSGVVEERVVKINNPKPIAPNLKSGKQIARNKNYAVPEQQAVVIDAGSKIQDAGLETQNKNDPSSFIFNPGSSDLPSPDNLVNQQANNIATQPTDSVNFNQNLPFPSKPKESNKIVGMVLSQNNELINDAIVEIQNKSGQVVRAVKSNSLGQFFVSTPLKSGEYVLRAEKQDFSFPDYKLILEDKIVDPIEIKAS